MVPLGQVLLLAGLVTMTALFVMSMTVWRAVNVPRVDLVCTAQFENNTVNFALTQTLDVSFDMATCGQFITFLLKKSSLPQEFSLVAFQNPSFTPDPTVLTSDANQYFLNSPVGQDKPTRGTFRIQFDQPTTTFTYLWNGD